MDMIARLRAERQALVARLSEIDKILAQYEQIERAAQQLLGGHPPIDSQAMTAEPVEHDAPPTPVALPDRAVSAKNKTPIDEFEQAVIDVLEETAAPMDRVQLYGALTERGIVIGDGDRDKELNALSARVYRMTQAGRLTSRRGQGYSLKTDGDVDDLHHGPQHEAVPLHQEAQEADDRDDDLLA
ncbi:hypothetical protein [Paenirhodobacter sp.]|uniref:hypothetical protein n=1 Tax=Paenirhodobacter sp. TaxID=1965326 RepID=UPI003B3E7926